MADLFTTVLGVLIVMGLIVLIVIESTSQTRVKTITQTDVLPVPYYVRGGYRNRHHYRPSPQPQPHHYRPVVGDRSTPFCQHTSNGCYPGTQTPIP